MSINTLRSLLTAWLLLALSPLAAAQTISGIGARSCSAYSQAAELKSEAALDAYLAWGQGFISAFNWSNARKANVSIAHAGLTYWLLEWCARNPDRQFYEALQESIRVHAR